MSPSSENDPQPAYQGARFNVYTATIPSRDGTTVQRDVVVAPGAAVILPLIDPATVVLIQNHRFAVDQTLWELPAGTIEEGEAPLVCAARELTEEAGYRANRITPITDFYPSPGICTERMHAFLAQDLEWVGQQLDPNERITVEVMPLKQSMQMIQNKTIRDGKTIATLLYYHIFLTIHP